MQLAEHQRRLLGLFRGTHQVSSDDDAYINRVAQSKDLEEGRRNISLWRVYVLERTCALTVTLLRRRNLFEQTLSSFITLNNVSPFRETQAPAFLEAQSGHPEHLIASVAQFELALMKVRQGDPSSYVIHWDVEPYSVLNSLAKDLPLEKEISERPYQILVSRDIPHEFQVLSTPAEVRTRLGL